MQINRHSGRRRLSGIHPKQTTFLLQYNVAMKFHYLVHMGEDIIFLNPRVGWTLSDEDYVGKVKLVCSSCVTGTATHNNRVTLRRAAGCKPRPRPADKPVLEPTLYFCFTFILLSFYFHFT